MAITFKQVQGTFKQRGDESIKYLPTITEFAQEHLINNIINVGGVGTYWISVVTYITKDEPIPQMQMVKRGTYELMDFQKDEELKAFNNMNKQVQRFIGAYSNKYNVR